MSSHAEYVVVATPGAARCWREIADVIICEAYPQLPDAVCRLHSVLRRHPGCAVAAAGLGPGACVVAARCGSVATLTVRPPSGAPGIGAIACASVAHGWLCTGQPLAALDQAAVRVSAGQPGVLGRPGSGRCPILLVVAGRRTRVGSMSGMPQPYLTALWSTEVFVESDRLGQMFTGPGRITLLLGGVGQEDMNACLLVPSTEPGHGSEGFVE